MRRARFGASLCRASRHLVNGAGLVLVRHIAQGVDGLRRRARTVLGGGAGLALFRVFLFDSKSSISNRSSASSPYELEAQSSPLVLDAHVSPSCFPSGSTTTKPPHPKLPAPPEGTTPRA